MKKIILMLVLFLILTNLIHCHKKEQNDNFPPLTKDEITPERLWKRIAEETNFDDYKFWPTHKGLRRGQSPHGVYHEIYINDILYNSLPIKNKIAPIGSIVVKENFSADKEFNNLTVMAKIKDYDPQNNDWFWAIYSSEKGDIPMRGKEGSEGKIEMCYTCHSGMKDNDYIIVQPLDKEIKEE